MPDIVIAFFALGLALHSHTGNVLVGIPLYFQWVMLFH